MRVASRDPAPRRTDRRAGWKQPASELSNPGGAIGPRPDRPKADKIPGRYGLQYSTDRARLRPINDLATMPGRVTRPPFCVFYRPFVQVSHQNADTKRRLVSRKQ